MPNCFPVSTSELPAFHPAIESWRRSYSPGPLTADELEHFYQYGFVIKHDLLPSARLEATIAAVSREVDTLAHKLLAGGRITNTCQEEDFYHRLTALESQFPSVCTLLHRQGSLAPEMQELWTSNELMGVAKQILGPDTAGHPVWNLRTKIPSPPTEAAEEERADQSTVPMHQDAAYLDPTADHVLQLTAWIPMLNATVQNGCMQVLKGGHRTGVVAPHVGCAGASWYLEMLMDEIPSHLAVSEARDLVTCEVPFGSVLFLNNLIPHRSLPNQSDRIRWSMDLRWQKPSLPSGYYGLKEPIVLSKADDPCHRPDWAHWAAMDRLTLEASAAKDAVGNTECAKSDPFETRICGPWMDRWPLTNENRHTKMWSATKNATTEQKKVLTWKS